MKRSDIFTISIIAMVGTLAAFFGVNAFLGDPNDESVTFNVLPSISAEILKPDSELFNLDAINPTVEVYVGDCVDIDQNGILDINELVACGVLDQSVLETEDKDAKDDDDSKKDKKEGN